MLRKVLYIMLFVVLCVCVGGGAFAYWRISDANWLAMQVQKLTRQHAGIDVDIKDGVKMEFSPRPTLVLGNVHVHRMDGGLSAFIEKIEVVPVIKSIFDGELNIHHVEIVHPVLEIDTSILQKRNDASEIVAKSNEAKVHQERIRIVSELNKAISYIFVDKLSSISLQNADISIVTPDTTYIQAHNVNFEMAIEGSRAEVFFDVNHGSIVNGSIGSLDIKNVSLAIPRIEMRNDSLDKDTILHNTMKYIYGDMQFDVQSVAYSDVRNEKNIYNIVTKDVHLSLKDIELCDNTIKTNIKWHIDVESNSHVEDDNAVPLQILTALGINDVILPKMNLSDSLEASLYCDFAQETVIVNQGLLTLSGTVELEDYPRNIALRLPFTWDQEKMLRLADVSVSLDGNALNLSAECTGLREGKPVAKGHVDMQHLSLTQLFGFARKLPNGLQNTLNDIKGQLDFEVDTNKVVASRIDAVVCGLDLTGTAHIADFSYPDLVLDISGPYLDANRVLPEINNQRPEAPTFAMKPLIPAPDEAESSESGDEGHFGFDIRVHAKDVDVYVLALRDLDFRCIPSKRGTLLTFDSPNMYGGLVDLHLDITDGYELEGTIKNISLAEPLTQLAGWPAVSGTAQLGFDIKAPFRRTLKTVLDGLTGKLDLKADKGIVLVDKSPETKPFPYAEVSLLAHIEKEGAKPKNTPENWLSYDGTWRGHWRFPNGEFGRYDMDGVVHFDFDTILPVACTKVPARIHAFFPESETSIPKGVTTDFDALVTAQLDARWVTFNKMKGTSRGIAYKGQAKVEGIGSSMRWSGSFGAEHPSMRELLKTIDFNVWPTEDAEAFGPMTLTSKFSYAGGVLSLQQAQFLMDESRYGGNVRIVDTRGSNTRPLLYFDMTVDSFNANRYLPKKVEDTKTNPEKIANAEKAWNLAPWFMCDIDGRCSFGELFLSKQRFTHVFAPILLEDGLFTMDELDASLHGGQVTVASRVRVHDSKVKNASSKMDSKPSSGLHAELVVNTRSLNVESLAATVTDKDYLGGTLDNAMSLQGDFACDADLTRALDGEWFIAIKDGYLSQSGQGEQRDKRIAFSSATASGLVDKGLVTNDNLSMESLLIDMDGHGWLNLVTKTVDYNVDVAFAQVPNIPISITGSWDKPNVSVNGVGIVTGTLVNIGSSVFNILGSVLMAPFDFLSLIGLGIDGDSNPSDNGSIGPQGDGVQGSRAFVPILSLPPVQQ